MSFITNSNIFCLKKVKKNIELEKPRSSNLNKKLFFLANEQVIFVILVNSLEWLSQRFMAFLNFYLYFV
jgi:hypothetical protein